jgi:superfamily II DNA/RNA helicase
VQEKDDDAEDDGSVLSSLLDEMRPYVLRRVKAHVEKSVPPKEEIVVSVALAPLQKRYYRALYEKNVLMLAGTGRPVDGPSLMNLAMELRKCCNHPFLLKGVERQEEARLSGQTERERLVGACGKLQFLDKLLPRLFQESNRKVLIFSQFVMMLDVLSDYLRSAKYAHGRVDGGVTGRDRQKQIDQFAQQGDGAVRVMLLSTRAGGVGINLVAADTVVVYDSDWNPQNDVQAMARCHRIGQTRKVTVYRLLTAGTYEAHMYAVATAKLSLDRAVLDGMASANAGNRHLHESLLKQGAGAVSFKPHAVNKELDGDDDEDAKAFRDQSLDDILATRSKAVVLASDTSGGALESLSSATFVASKEEDKIALDDPDFWEKTLGKDALKQKKEIVDTTQRKAKQGDKEYVHNYGPVDRVKKRQRDADYYEDVPEDKKEQHPYDWGKTQARELRLVLPKRPIGMEPSRFVRGYCSLERRPEPKDAISAAHDALASYGRAMARERHHIASERGDDTSSWRRMKSGGHIDQDWVSKLITRNRALKSSLTAIVKREAPDRSIDLETLIAAFYGATNTPGAAAVSFRRWRLAPPVRRHRDVAHASILRVVASMASTPTSDAAGPDRHEHAIAARARRHRSVQRRLPRRERLRPER